MSDQYVQSTSAGNTSSTATATLNGVTAGNTIVAFLVDTSDSNPSTHTVADGQGSYTQGNAAGDSAHFEWVSTYYLVNANAGTHAVVGTVTSGNGILLVVAEIGAPTSSSVPASGTAANDQASPGTGTDALTSTTCTTTGNSTLVGLSLDVASGSASDEPAHGTGFSTRLQANDSNAGPWTLETGAKSSSAAATFTAITGTNNFLTGGVMVLNPGTGFVPDEDILPDTLATVVAPWVSIWG